jgi:hypothetical protein
VAFPIALEEFAEAYRVTGLKPGAYCFLAEDCVRACPLGAAYVRAYGPESLARSADSSGMIDVLRFALGLTVTQVLAFTFGFDGITPLEIEDLDAFEAGRAARARFLPPQPSEA